MFKFKQFWGLLLLISFLIFPTFPMAVLGSEETSSSEVDQTVVLAVNESNGFQTSANYSNNYRAVGSTFYNSSNKYVYLSNGGLGTAGSFFTKNKVFLTNFESAGFSSFFEMSLFAANGYADGFTFIVSKDINVLGQSGGAIGYGGIPNSIAVMFDNFDNGGQPPLCLSLGVNGTQGPCTKYNGPTSGNFKIWIDYERATGNLDVRINPTNFVRPLEPTRRFPGVVFDGIGNEFYTGFTASTGGFSQYAYLRSWFFSAAYVPSGIDPSEAANFVTDNVPPATPVVEPLLVDGEWLFRPDPLFTTEPGLNYIYTLGNNEQYAFYNPSDARAQFTTADQQLRLFSLDNAGNRSLLPGTYPYYRATYVLNIPGSSNVVKFYPSANANYPITQLIDLMVPIRPGYRFDGWATTPVQTINLKTTHTFGANAFFFARWSFLPYTITFETNGGTSIAPVNTDLNQGFTLPNPPTKPHYQFAGWFLDEALTQPLNLESFPHVTLTLFAKWTIESHTLTVLWVDGNQTDEYQFDYGTEVDLTTLTPDHTEDFYFAGFYLDEALTQAIQEGLVLAGDLTLYQKWIDLRPIRSFYQSVDQLPQPISLLDEANLLSAREAYLELNDDQLTLLNPDYLNRLIEAEAHLVDLKAVAQVVLLIDALPRIVTLDDQTLIAEAMTAYANLTPQQKALFPLDREHHLNDISEQYGHLNAAAEVEVMVWQLPDDVRIEHIPQITAIIDSFFELTEEESAMLDPWVVLKIQSLENKLTPLLICQSFVALVALIDSLPFAEKEAAILEAFAFYASMSQEARGLLETQHYQALLNHSKAFQDETLARPVQALIDSLPATITLNNESMVQAAQQAFLALSNDQQQYIDVSKLEAALAEIARLKAEVDEENQVDPEDPLDPEEPIDPEPPLPEEQGGYFPWIVIVVLVTWLGGYWLYQKQH